MGTQTSSDTEVTIFAGDEITVRANNDDAFFDEPCGIRASRACFVAPASPNNETVFIKVFPHSGTSFNVRMRIIETTLWLPWFFTGGDYTSFILIRNTTNSPVTGVVVTTRNLAGVITSTTGPLSIGGNASLPFQILASPNGTVEVAHSGSPQGRAA